MSIHGTALKVVRIIGAVPDVGIVCGGLPRIA